MENKEYRNISRRDFLKTAGAAAAAVGLSGCAGGSEAPASVGGAGEMTYRTNHKTGDKVSLLGYGCMRWPMKPGSDGNGDVVDQQTVERLVDYAIGHGVNYFDAAPVYCQGYCEESTGKALSRHPREDHYIATKLSNQTFYRVGLRGKELLDASVGMYHESMKLFRTDYIDYYLFHSLGSNFNDLNGRIFDCGVAEYFLKEREAGRIRNLGFSFHGDVEVFDYLLQKSGIDWDFVQIQMNYVDWKHAQGASVGAEYLYGELAKRNIPVVIMEPLLGGRLSNMPSHIVARLKQREPQRSVASWAFRYAGTFPEVLTVLSGMTYMEHLQDNISSYSPLVPLNEEEFAFLYDTVDMMMDYPTIPCNDCKYCMPCPYGIDIPGVLLHYNKCVNEGNVVADESSMNYRKARRAFLVGYDRSVPKLRQADHCIACKECVPLCPQSINIPAEMLKINAFAEELKRSR